MAERILIQIRRLLVKDLKQNRPVRVQKVPKSFHYLFGN